MATVRDVIEVWEAVTNRRLSYGLRDLFGQRPEVSQLTQYGRYELERAGRNAMRSTSNGTILRLDEWLTSLRVVVTKPAPGRLGCPEDLLSPDLLGPNLATTDLAAVTRHPLTKEILRYTRKAITDACRDAPHGQSPADVLAHVLGRLRALEKKAASHNYNPLLGRSDKYDHRPSAVGDDASRRIGPIQRYDDS